MTTREALIAAIAAEPLADTPRLVFADFLDECGEGDLDAATVEFIRLSCTPKGTAQRMPPKAYQWLKANWERLLPRTRAASAAWSQKEFGEPPGWMPPVWSGRNLRAGWNVFHEGVRRPYTYLVRLRFDRGFVVRFKCHVNVYRWLTATLFQEQPLVERFDPRPYLSVFDRQVRPWTVPAAFAGPRPILPSGSA